MTPDQMRQMEEEKEGGIPWGAIGGGAALAAGAAIPAIRNPLMRLAGRGMHAADNATGNVAGSAIDAGADAFRASGAPEAMARPFNVVGDKLQRAGSVVMPDKVKGYAGSVANDVGAATNIPRPPAPSRPPTNALGTIQQDIQDGVADTVYRGKQIAAGAGALANRAKADVFDPLKQKARSATDAATSEMKRLKDKAGNLATTAREKGEKAASLLKTEKSKQGSDYLNELSWSTKDSIFVHGARKTLPDKELSKSQLKHMGEVFNQAAKEGQLNPKFATEFLNTAVDMRQKPGNIGRLITGAPPAGMDAAKHAKWKKNWDAREVDVKKALNGGQYERVIGGKKKKVMEPGLRAELSKDDEQLFAAFMHSMPNRSKEEIMLAMQALKGNKKPVPGSLPSERAKIILPRDRDMGVADVAKSKATAAALNRNDIAEKARREIANQLFK